ncbi:MAG: hypothetical protein KJP00_08550 [Bacteroidia bacterium]|nr:hypothetical protein [Bacteroidia bacterium]
MNKVLDHLSKNWIEYGFQTFVVVVSILIAFSLDAWYEQRQSLKSEVKILKELRADLQANYIELSSIRDSLESRKLTVDSAIHSIKNDLPFRPDLFRFLTRPGGGLFNSANTAYKLIESGGLNLLSNDSLRIGITTMYETDFANIHRRQDNLWTFYENQVHDLRLDLFEVSDGENIPRSNSKYIEPKDPEALRQNLRFKNVLVTIFGETNGRIVFLGRTLEKLKLLIQQTEEEIRNLEA